MTLQVSLLARFYAGGEGWEIRCTPERTRCSSPQMREGATVHEFASGNGSYSFDVHVAESEDARDSRFQMRVPLSIENPECS